MTASNTSRPLEAILHPLWYIGMRPDGHIELPLRLTDGDSRGTHWLLLGIGNRNLANPEADAQTGIYTMNESLVSRCDWLKSIGANLGHTSECESRSECGE